MSIPATERLPVAVDAMGGDFGPSVVVEGAVQAARELDLPSILVGNEPELQALLESQKMAGDPRVQICHAPEVVTMEDSPGIVIRKKPDCSIRKAFELVREGKASSMVSPGNTGAVMAAGVFVSGTLPGIGRPAIASLIPRIGTDRPAVLLDSGANIDCHAHQLVQFALMGHYYARSVLSTESPRVALLSNGAEASKGNDITRAAAMMLTQSDEVNYVGYVEGRDLSSDSADVIVCDGFVGNIVLKTMEGSVGLVLDSIKCHVERSFRGRFGLWLAKPLFKELFRKKLDPSFYGGAPLLGLNDIAIICHGSSTSRAIMNAIRVARKFDDEGLIGRMNQALSLLDQETPGAYEDGMWNRMGQKFERRKRRAKGEDQKEPGAEADTTKVEEPVAAEPNSEKLEERK